MTRPVRPLSGLAVAVICSALAAPVAEASFPGRDGRIVFEREGAHKNTTLFSVSPGTGHVTRLTAVPRRCQRSYGWDDLDPAYVPSGRSMVFEHFGCGPDGIYRMRADGTHRKLLIRDTRRYWHWWPTAAARRLVLIKGPSDSPTGGIFATSFPTPGPLQLLVSDQYADVDTPALSSTGRLAYMFNEHIVRLDRSGRRVLVTRSSRDESPDWSPNARHIAFERSTPLQYRLLGGEVFTVSARGVRGGRPQGLRRLTHTLDAFAPVWSPSGTRIAYVRAREVEDTGALYIMDRDGGNKRRVVGGVVASRISWQPRPR